MNDVWTRLHKALTSMSERLDYGSKEDKKVFRDSFVGNVNDMIELLRVCNVTHLQPDERHGEQSRRGNVWCDT